MAQNNKNPGKSTHSGHRQRVKEEFLARGVEGWQDHRILELLLFYAHPQGDVNPLAHELIEKFGSLTGVLDASPEELKKISGVGEHTVTLLRLIPAVGARYLRQRGEMGELIRSLQDVSEILMPYFFGARNEMVYILCLDGKGKVLGVRKIAEGSIQSADISIRRIAEEALGLRAAGIYLAHNHVSNLALPSGADWMTLDALEMAMSAIGVQVHDHVIFVDGDMVSLQTTENSGSRRSYQYY